MFTGAITTVVKFLGMFFQRNKNSFVYNKNLNYNASSERPYMHYWDEWYCYFITLIEIRLESRG